jgi:hypothetical protein
MILASFRQQIEKACYSGCARGTSTWSYHRIGFMSLSVLASRLLKIFYLAIMMTWNPEFLDRLMDSGNAGRVGSRQTRQPGSATQSSWTNEKGKRAVYESFRGVVEETGAREILEARLGQSRSRRNAVMRIRSHC